MVAHTSNLALRRKMQGDFYEFKASLDYTGSPRTARATLFKKWGKQTCVLP